jgi:sodium-independent sulfate anion transporter 11
MSLEVAKVIAHVKATTGNSYTNPEIATALAFVCGVVCLGVGLIRAGFILEFIPGMSFFLHYFWCRVDMI